MRLLSDIYQIIDDDNNNDGIMMLRRWSDQTWASSCNLSVLVSAFRYRKREAGTSGAYGYEKKVVTESLLTVQY